MYIPEGVPGILVQPAWGSFPWNRAPCKRTQDWLLYAPGCRGAALLPLKGARKIPRESDWSRSVDTRRGPVDWHSGPKTPGGPGATVAPLLGTAGRALDPAGGREAVGCRIHADWGPGHPPQGDM